MHRKIYSRSDSLVSQRSRQCTGIECKARVTETGIVLGRNICVPEIDERKKNRRVSRCFMHPAQRVGDRAIVYAVVGEREKRINIRRYARTEAIRASVRPKVPCWQGDFEFSYPDHSYLGGQKDPDLRSSGNSAPSRNSAKHAL